jgi:hypothetical protein
MKRTQFIVINFMCSYLLKTHFLPGNKKFFPNFSAAKKFFASGFDVPCRLLLGLILCRGIYNTSVKKVQQKPIQR